MPMKFKHIFTGIRMRLRKKNGYTFINLITFFIIKRAIVGNSGL